MPVIHFNHKALWMNHSIFKARFNNIFVPQVHKHLRWKGLPEKVVLLLHNVSAHPNGHVLKSDNGKVSVKYLPPNVTTLIQPMNRSTTATVKYTTGNMFYRNMLIKAMI
jgi:hypothetical protein